MGSLDTVEPVDRYVFLFELQIPITAENTLDEELY